MQTATSQSSPQPQLETTTLSHNKHQQQPTDDNHRQHQSINCINDNDNEEEVEGDDISRRDKELAERTDHLVDKDNLLETKSQQQVVDCESHHHHHQFGLTHLEDSYRESNIKTIVTNNCSQQKHQVDFHIKENDR